MLLPRPACGAWPLPQATAGGSGGGGGDWGTAASCGRPCKSFSGLVVKLGSDFRRAALAVQGSSTEVLGASLWELAPGDDHDQSFVSSIKAQARAGACATEDAAAAGGSGGSGSWHGRLLASLLVGPNSATECITAPFTLRCRPLGKMASSIRGYRCGASRGPRSPAAAASSSTQSPAICHAARPSRPSGRPFG